MTYDLAIAGAGIVGLGHAVAAVRRGLSVVIVERDARPVGASIRNFGFVTVTGQRRGDTWRRAKRSADIWADIAPRARIDVEHRGLVLLARRPEAAAVLEAFSATEMGEACELLSAAATRRRFADLQPDGLAAALYSPHEMRVESRLAIPRLVEWLERHGVDFRFQTAALGAEQGALLTSRGSIRADAIVLSPGDDLVTFYPDLIAGYGVTRCVLQMLRLDPPGFRLPAALMSDLSLVRYRGYADLPESAALLQRLEQEQAEHLRHGVHLIAVQSADGSLVVGDSHHYHASPEPFAESAVESLMLDELRAAVGVALPVRERWIGTYSSADQDMFCAAPADGVRLVMVTSGTGASTAFAIAEETLDGLIGRQTERPLP